MFVHNIPDITLELLDSQTSESQLRINNSLGVCTHSIVVDTTNWGRELSGPAWPTLSDIWMLHHYRNTTTKSSLKQIHLDRIRLYAEYRGIYGVSEPRNWLGRDAFPALLQARRVVVYGEWDISLRKPRLDLYCYAPTPTIIITTTETVVVWWIYIAGVISLCWGQRNVSNDP